MNVLLTGTYSSFNKGDLAMQLTAARELKDRGATVVASVPFPRQDREIYAKHGVDVVPSNRRKLIQASWQLLRLVAWRSLSWMPERFVRWLPPAELAHFRSADMVIDLSGDMLTDDYGPHVAYSHFLPLISARLSGTPYAVMAQSIGPFRYTTVLARSVLRNAALVTVRDPISVTHVEGLGLDRPELTSDLAFLLRPASDDQIATTWEMEGLPQGRVLGVSVSGLVASHHERRNPSANQQPLHVALGKALDDVASSHDLSVVFFPHVTGPTEEKDDRIAAAAVAAVMRHPAHLVTGDYSPDLIKGMIARCHLFVGARMHANIAALSSCVPVVAISYSHKSLGIMQLFDQGNRVIDVAQLTTAEVVDRLNAVLDEADSISEALAERRPEVEERSGANIQAVLELMGHQRKAPG